MVYKDSKFGVGTDDPTDRVQIDLSSDNLDSPEGLFINNIDGTLGNNASVVFSTDSGHRKKSAISHVDTGDYGRGDLVFSIDPDADTGSLDVVAHEKLRIKSEGHVGIGTTVPTDVAHSTNDKIISVGICTANELYGLLNGVNLAKVSGTATLTDGGVIIIDEQDRGKVHMLEYTFYFKLGTDIQTQKLLVMNDRFCGDNDFNNVYSTEYALMYNVKRLVDVQGYKDTSGSPEYVKIKVTGYPGLTGTLEYCYVRNLIFSTF